MFMLTRIKPANSGAVVIELRQTGQSVTGNVTLIEAGVGQTQARLVRQLSADSLLKAILDKIAKSDGFAKPKFVDSI